MRHRIGPERGEGGVVGFVPIELLQHVLQRHWHDGPPSKATVLALDCMVDASDGIRSGGGLVMLAGPVSRHQAVVVVYVARSPST